ncbi:VanZ family protein [Agromyces seonyuensis]|uniref:VanZ family protein n=1 Tax=Agromyces seonyuensis TaxID=2662446 RepID=A0A6I4P847_9MICO|nr:VanZ family protein [Agromyces seonyuensis]MWC00058.1 VanZ family protein [Agromyces seonyuensis]
MSAVPAASRSRATRTRTPAVLFAIYLVLLAWMVVLRFQLPWEAGQSGRLLKLVPFVASGGFGASAPREVLANVLIFVPFGLYLGLLRPTWSRPRAALVFAGGSLALEAAQYVLATGSTDVTDIIVNTAGGLIGLAVVRAIGRASRGRALPALTRVCAVATAVAVLAVGLFVASPVQYGPPGERPPRPGPAVVG